MAGLTHTQHMFGKDLDTACSLKKSLAPSTTAPYREGPEGEDNIAKPNTTTKASNNVGYFGIILCQGNF